MPSTEIWHRNKQREAALARQKRQQRVLQNFKDPISFVRDHLRSHLKGGSLKTPPFSGYYVGGNNTWGGSLFPCARVACVFTIVATHWVMGVIEHAHCANTGSRNPALEVGRAFRKYCKDEDFCATDLFKLVSHFRCWQSGGVHIANAA